MATMKEEKVLTIKDGVFDETFSIDDSITIMWNTVSDSFKQYFNSNFTEEEKEECTLLNEWETCGTLVGWTETEIIINEDGNKTKIPIKDIKSVYP